jgi:hypothetical protein
MGWGLPRATVKLKEKVRLMDEYSPEYFLEFSGKPVRKKSDPQIGFTSLIFTAIFGYQAYPLYSWKGQKYCSHPFYPSQLG